MKTPLILTAIGLFAASVAPQAHAQKATNVQVEINVSTNVDARRDSDPCTNVSYDAPTYIVEICNLRRALTSGRATLIHFYDDSQAFDNIVADGTFSMLKREYAGNQMGFYTANVKANLVLSHYLPHRYFEWDGRFATASIGVIDGDGYLIQLFKVQRSDNVMELHRRIANFLDNMSYFVTNRDGLLQVLRNPKPTLLFFIHEYSDNLQNVVLALDELQRRGSGSLRNDFNVVMVPVSSDAASLKENMSRVAIAPGGMAAFAIFDQGNKQTTFTQVDYGDDYSIIAENLRTTIRLFKDHIN